ncbi:MAG: hydrogenase expression/formation protein HypE [Desulfobulbaceae bacterium]|nr:hydrogenase expression/formation protein HypE [Desulfobulbaceae bacterium]
MTKIITLDHGSGGQASDDLIKNLFLKYLTHPELKQLNDSAVLEQVSGKLAFSTDSYVVDPIFFPGGDIGELAVNGTINDLSMMGARPLYLSLGLIIEEGLDLDDLEKIIYSIGRASEITGVPIVTGDTKVVPKGKGDKIFINTSGIGVIDSGIDIGPHRIKEGDKIILSGTMADHGVTILTKRAEIDFSGSLTSDTTALHNITSLLLDHFPGDIHAMRDPTRGGVANVLNELAENTELNMEIKESNIPIRAEVKAACELLGLDPLYLANEGKCLIFVSATVADETLKLLRNLPEGKMAAIIGHTDTQHPGKVILNTNAGGRRLVNRLIGAPLPRIC